MRYHELNDDEHGDGFADFIAHGEPQILDESPRASAVTKPEIPAKYKGLKLLGRGMTSLVFEKDAHSVLIFTRDSMKMEYLRDTGLARVVDHFESYQNPIRGLNEFEVYVIEMPKLHKLAGKNVGLVRKAMKEYDEVFQQHYRAGVGNWKRAKRDATRDAVRHFSAQENHMLEPLWNFLVNYDESQYYMDLGTRNFLQTDDGQIVCVDPIVQSDLLDMLDAHHAKKYENQGVERW